MKGERNSRNERSRKAWKPKADEDDYLVDGIHPNANGTRLYGELFAEELGKSVERKSASEDESDMPKERESGILQEKANAETETVEKEEKT